MDAPYEVWVGTLLHAFDGRVLEVFEPTSEGSARHHVLMLQQFQINGAVLTGSTPESGILVWPFTEAQRSGVEALVTSVNSARGVR